MHEIHLPSEMDDLILSHPFPVLFKSFFNYGGGGYDGGCGGVQSSLQFHDLFLMSHKSWFAFFFFFFFCFSSFFFCLLNIIYNNNNNNNKKPEAYSHRRSRFGRKWIYSINLLSKMEAREKGRANVWRKLPSVRERKASIILVSRQMSY